MTGGHYSLKESSAEILGTKTKTAVLCKISNCFKVRVLKTKFILDIN